MVVGRLVSVCALLGLVVTNLPKIQRRLNKSLFFQVAGMYQGHDAGRMLILMFS